MTSAPPSDPASKQEDVHAPYQASTRQRDEAVDDIYERAVHLLDLQDTFDGAVDHAYQAASELRLAHHRGEALDTRPMHEAYGALRLLQVHLERQMRTLGAGLAELSVRGDPSA